MNLWKAFFAACLVIGTVLVACKLFGLVALSWWVVLIPFNIVIAGTVVLIVGFILWMNEGGR